MPARLAAVTPLAPPPAILHLGPRVLLAAFLVVHVVQRLAELTLSSGNARRLLARGGREHGRGHLPWIVVLHVAFPLAIAAEVLGLRTRPGPFAPVWLGAWIAAQLVRLASMHALGARWTVRVIVLPGEAPLRRGLYRWLPHPNYLAVVVELLAAPMMLGAWRTAIAFSLANLAVLGVRVRCEDHALAEAAAAPPR